MIIATTEQNDGASDTWGDVNKFVPVSAADQLYFDVKETQWPNKGSKPNGFPWISNRAPQTYHEESKAISVSSGLSIGRLRPSNVTTETFSSAV